MWEKHRCGVYIPPTGFYSESVKVVRCHHISGPHTKIEAPLMVKDKAEVWMENQLPSLYCRKLTLQGISILTEIHFTHSIDQEIVETLISGTWSYCMFQSIPLSLSLPSPSIPFPALSSLTPDHISLLHHTTSNSLIFALIQYTSIKSIKWLSTKDL